MQCTFCGKPNYRDRVRCSRLKYCSDICNKRAYVVRKKNALYSRFLPQTRLDYYEKTASGKAFFWEIWAAEKMGAEHANRDVMNKPYDLLIDGKTIDVKIAELYKRKMKRGRKTGEVSGTWCFHSEPWAQSNFFLCIGLVQNKPEKIFYIPHDEMPSKGCTIGRHKSKYDKFLIELT